MFEIWNSQRRNEMLQHSAKGSSWKKHKYIKKVDGTYYYPSWYEGGRHMDPEDEKKAMAEQQGEDGKTMDWKWGSGATVDEKSEKVEDLRDADIDELARMVIKGEFGNGATRRELLGEDYSRVQDKVNEMLLGPNWKSGAQEKLDEMTGRKEVKETMNKGLHEATKELIESARDPMEKALSNAANAVANAGKSAGDSLLRKKNKQPGRMERR